MAGMGGLSGLAFVNQGYNKGAQDYWNTQNLESDDAEKQALGRGLQLLRQSPVPGAQPMGGAPQGVPVPPQLQPQVGGPSQPSFARGGVDPTAAMTGTGPMSGGVSPDGGGMRLFKALGGGQPSPFEPGPQGGPPYSPPMGPDTFGFSGPVQVPPTLPGARSLPQQPPVPMPNSAPQPQPQSLGNQQGMPLDLQRLISKIQEANPGIQPKILAGAVTKALPLLQTDSQQYWHMLTAQLGRDRLAMTERGQDIGLQKTGMKPEVQALDRFLEQNPNATPAQMAEFIRSTKTAARPAGAGTPSQQLLQRFFAEHPDATAEQAAEFLKTQKATPAAEVKQQQAQQAGQSVLQQIDSAIKDVDDSMHGGSAVTGITGRIQRGLEFFGGTTGIDSGTKASDFQTKIRLIQTQLPRLIAGTSRLSADERAHLEEVVRGLGTFTSPEQAKTALEYVQSVIRSRMGTGTPAGAVPAGVVTKPPGQPPQPAGSTPPASMLKEGVGTTFRNGQTWTLQNGQPVQVQGGEGAGPFDQQSSLGAGDPSEIAAARQRQAVRPAGGRKEGVATAWIVGQGEKLADALVSPIKHPENLVGTGALGMARYGAIRANPSDVADIRRMVSEGKSMSEIGEWLGISRDAVHGLMTRLGVRSPAVRAAPGQAAVPHNTPLLDPDFDLE